MYFTYDKTSYRLSGSLINGLIAFVFGIYATFGTVAFIFSSIYDKFNWRYLALLTLIWLELIFTFRTFKKNVSAGPNSALWNLPLLYIDLCFIVLASNTLVLYLDVIGYGNYLRFFLFIFPVLRYIGLAWTSPAFFLKRIFSPIRQDCVMEGASEFP